jgi:hypothetical protein
LIQSQINIFKGCIHRSILHEYLELEEFPLRVYRLTIVLVFILKTEQLSQELFSADGTVYNQTLILNDRFEVDPKLLSQQGLVCRLFDLN